MTVCLGWWSTRCIQHLQGQKSIRNGAPPPVPRSARLVELQFEAAPKKSIAEVQPVVPPRESPAEPVC